jgi:hypothetical protein
VSPSDIDYLQKENFRQDLTEILHAKTYLSMYKGDGNSTTTYFRTLILVNATQHCRAGLGKKDSIAGTAWHGMEG